MAVRILLFTTCLLWPGLLLAQRNPAYTTAQALEQVLTPTARQTKPLILAHRGGPQQTQTENSLETFRYTYRLLPDAILEMDVRMTADSVLVLLHDDEVERTTTGTGSLRQMTWRTARQLFLRDLSGKPTKQRMARFADVLRWGSGRVLMAIDAKPGVDLLRVMKEIATAKALNSVFIICYSVEDARLIRSHYPDCWLALGFSNAERVTELKQAGLAVRHLVALASPQPASFYQQLRAAGIPSTVGTYGAGNLDTQPLAEAAESYRKLVRAGATIITTDRPVEVDSVFR